MSSPSLPQSLSETLRPVAAYAAAVLYALAREEHAGRRPPRITEADHATWRRFRGRLGWHHFLELLLEDAAAVQGVPFDPEAMLPGPAGLEEIEDEVVERLVEEIAGLELDADGTEYVAAQARLLGLPDRMARSDLHRVLPHQKILELPGTGGQLCHHLALRDGIYLQDSATIACGDWRELVLAGLIAVDLGAPHADFARLDPELEATRETARESGFDVVVGRTPERGGRLAEGRLRELFPGAQIVLV